MDEYLYLWAQWGMLRCVDDYEKLKKTYGNLQSAWHKVTPGFFATLNFEANKIQRAFAIRERLDFNWIAQKLSHHNVRLYFFEDTDYPKPLKHVKAPPVFLFVRGHLPHLHKAMAVVGTRNMTSYGQLVTQKFVCGLVQNGFVIVSGLALGVDACAHEVTLKNNGITVAVLGSGVDNITPRTNLRLAHQILQQGGAIVSEFPLGTPPLKHHFPMRNRIIAGLSRGTLVTEGGRSSGALITAESANDNGRDVFAVPGDITKPALSGTNHIIRKGEAKLVESAEDILQEYQMDNAQKPAQLSLSNLESELLGRLAQEPQSVDDLAMTTKYNVAKLSEALIDLHLKQVVRQVGQKWVIV